MVRFLIVFLCLFSISVFIWVSGFIGVLCVVRVFVVFLCCCSIIGCIVESGFISVMIVERFFFRVLILFVISGFMWWVGVDLGF